MTPRTVTATRGRRRPIRRAVYVLPSGLTIANLFFGVFAIVSASRGELSRAGLYVVLGGVMDMLDGRVARATNTGTRIGTELDSLVDVISFGVAPAMIMYFAVLNRNGWEWVWAFAFVAAAAVRLARFNVEQAGRAKRYFHGLPSPAAGLTLATYYWFSQTPLYNDTNIANLPWHFVLRFLMLGLAALMVSNASYPAMPAVGFRSRREIIGTLLVIGALIGVFFVPKQFFFPACLAYVLYGLGETVFVDLLGRRAGRDTPVITDYLEEPEDAVPGSAMTPEAAYALSETPGAPNPARRRKRRRRPRGPRPDRGPGANDSPSSPTT